MGVAPVAVSSGAPQKLVTHTVAQHIMHLLCGRREEHIRRLTTVQRGEALELEGGLACSFVGRLPGIQWAADCPLRMEST